MQMVTRQLRRTVFIGMGLWLLIVCGKDASASRLEGTFLQLSSLHEEWQEEDWRKLFDYFQDLQLSQLIIQWTVYGEEAFYILPEHKVVKIAPLETLIQLADSSGMTVLVGLAQDPRFWEKIKRDSALVEVYLRRLQLRSESVAQQLAPLLQDHPSFQGWYVPQEIDDISWRKPEARKVLFSYLRNISQSLHTLTPGRKVALSGFSGARSDPKAFEEFWTALLEAASFETVLFQDGIGVGKLQLEELPLYLAAMQRATQAHSRELQIVVETFRQIDGPPFNEKPFRAVPASLERIKRQLKLAASYSSSGIIAFSVPKYMTPPDGQAAGQLFQNYLRELQMPKGFSVQNR